MRTQGDRGAYWAIRGENLLRRMGGRSLQGPPPFPWTLSLATLAQTGSRIELPMATWNNTVPG